MSLRLHPLPINTLIVRRLLQPFPFTAFTRFRSPEVITMNAREKRRQHFLIATHPVQSHINPGLQLARRLLSISDVLVTFSTSESAHRRMFPDEDKSHKVTENGKLSFMPFPDGDWAPADASDVSNYQPAVGFSNLISNLASEGRHVTCVIPTLLLNWAADVARLHGIRCTQYWIQPATTFVTFYHYFHGFQNLISSNMKDLDFDIKLPHMPLMQIRDLPTFLTRDMSNGPYSELLKRFKENFDKLDSDIKCNKSKPKILVNSFEELEREAFASVDNVDLIGIGPLLSYSHNDIDDKNSTSDLFTDNREGYMDWLDKKLEKSVVYVSFGSISTLSKEQLEEVHEGLKASKLPYLWVIRKDNRYEGFKIDGGVNGMVVEWCSQVGVLSHPSIGCFVTHCGWNSTYESLLCGVPTVGVPQWTDQPTNAMLVDKLWKCGVKANVGEDGMVRREELVRCLEFVTVEGEKRDEIWRNVDHWKKKTRHAINEGGSSYRNLKRFVDEIGDEM